MPRGEQKPRPSDRPRREPSVITSPAIFSDAALLRLIDEWLVPRLVEEFISTTKCGNAQAEPHNGVQPP
jgi:hypothetical protein